MKAKASSCNHSDPAVVAASLRQDIADADAKLIVYFASAQYEPAALARAMAAEFPGVTTLGCTTAGEIVSGQMLDKSVVAMALGSDLVKRATPAVAERVSADGRAATKKAIVELQRGMGVALSQLDPARFCGIVLCDGLSGAEEAVMDEIGNASDLSFIGGSAGDDLQFKKTHVFVDGHAYSDVAALVLLEMAAPFRVVKTQSFRVLPKVLVATKVNEKDREVVEFDGRPAAEAYAAALGVPASALAAEFMRHPLGLLADGEPFVRSPQTIIGGRVRFYCQILEGMALHVLESTDIVADTGKAIDGLGQPSALINFHCILRTLELKAKAQCPAYGGLFAKTPTVGFSTYGEAYIGHINQTSTILVLGS